MAAHAVGASGVTGLRYDRASVGYDRIVVASASLDVSPGEVVGVIGPNGSGKTTLVRAVTGGSRVIEGRPVAEHSRVELARLVGVVPQAVPASFAFTARQYVEMGRHARLSRFGGLGASDHATVQRALELTDTDRLAGERVDTLSGGDLQRLTLAQALAQEPGVLLLDEPTSHLDLNHRLQILDLVRRLADEGLAVLAVFHDLDMAARYSDRLLVVFDGAVRPAAPPGEVLTAATLEEVFGVRAVVGTDIVTGSVQVTPILRSRSQAEPRGVSVLLVSGSGAGAAVMRRLVLEGFEVRAGALAVGDTDQQIAAAIGVPGTELPPYGDMDAMQEAEVSRHAGEADVVVVCATPFGRANVGNLRAVARLAGRTVLVGRLSAQDDFTGGEASRLWDGLVREGALECADAREIVRCVEEVAGR
jgi:iron complex transport system ATP-binding protein